MKKIYNNLKQKKETVHDGRNHYARSFLRPKALFSAVDDFVLQGFVQVVEVIAVAGDADDEVFVLFRVALGIEERFSIDDVELDVMTVHGKVRPNQRRQASQAFRAGDDGTAGTAVAGLHIYGAPVHDTAGGESFPHESAVPGASPEKAGYPGPRRY